MSGDQQIVGSDGRSGAFEVRTDEGVVLVDGRLERQLRNLSKECR